MNVLPEKKYGLPSQNFVQKIVLRENGDEITRFDGIVFINLPTLLILFSPLSSLSTKLETRQKLESRLEFMPRSLD
jgi:hypothetical protein